MKIDINSIAQAEVKNLSFSFSSNMKKTSIKHNERKEEDRGKLKDFGKHINWKKTKDNEILVSKKIKDVYKEEFQDAVDAYNAKQKRKDRKIKNYFSHVKKSKSLDTQKEFIVQVGKVGQQLDDDPKKNESLQKEALKNYLNLFQKTYPNLKVYSAVIHVDETSPHMHLAVVPVSKGYKRGVSKQPSFSKALGIKNIEDFKQFCEANRELMKEATEKALGATVTRERVGSHAYLPPQALREAWKEADAKKEEANAILEESQAKADEIISDAQKEAKKILKTRADVDADIKQYRAQEMSKLNKELELKKTEVNNAVSTYYKDALTREKADKAVKEREKAVAKSENELSRRESDLDTKEKRLDQQKSWLDAQETRLSTLYDSWLGWTKQFLSQIELLSAEKLSKLASKASKARTSIDTLDSDKASQTPETAQRISKVLGDDLTEDLTDGFKQGLEDLNRNQDNNQSL